MIFELNVREIWYETKQDWKLSYNFYKRAFTNLKLLLFHELSYFYKRYPKVYSILLKEFHKQLEEPGRNDVFILTLSTHGDCIEIIIADFVCCCFDTCDDLLILPWLVRLDWPVYPQNHHWQSEEGPKYLTKSCLYVLPLFVYFRSFQTNNTIFTTNQCEKMSKQYTAPGFEPTTCRTWVITHNH